MSDGMEMFKMQWQAAAEKRKNASRGNKGVAAACAFIALIYSGIICFFFFQEWDSAVSLKEDEKYNCIIQMQAKNNAASVMTIDYAEEWISWMQAAFICYLLLSIMAILGIVGAAMPALRLCAGCCSGCVGCFQAVVIIGLTVVRFNKFGTFCAENAGATADASISPKIAEGGMFLSNVIIAIWILSCCHNCCL